MPRHRRASRLSAVLVAGAAAALAVTALAAPAAAAAAPSWQLRSPGGTNHYRGLAPVSASVAWISGYQGQVLRTGDGGKKWIDVSPHLPGAGTLQFRDIEASNASHAVVMAAGSGGDSQLLVTDDGGKNWTVANRNADAAAFYDCMSFSDGDHGLVVSDPVDGRFRILSTSDGGHSWTVLPTAGMPAATTGEAGFAASGECLATSGDDAWFGTGGGPVARVFHSTDAGLTWTAATASVRTSASGGVFGLAFRTPSRGVIVGGDFAHPQNGNSVASTQLVGGAWRPSATMPTGYRSGVTWVPGTLGTVLAVGLTGSSVSTDGGRNWSTFDTGQFDTVSCSTDGACWAAGDKGRVATLNAS